MAKPKRKPARSTARPKATKKPRAKPRTKPKAKAKAKPKAKATKAPPKAAIDPRFRKEGRIEWAVLVPVAAAKLEAMVAKLNAKPHYLDDDEEDLEPRSWCVLAGSRQHSALIETEPGSTSTETELARDLSKQLGKTIYALGFAGYDDPDHGLPYIQRYDDGTAGLIWMAPTYDDEFPEPETVAGPRGVPAKDPFEFASALGCELRAFYEY